MHTDPSAPDLGAIRARLEPKLRTVGYVVIDHKDFRALLAAYDAQAARLAAVEQQLCDWQDHLRRVHHCPL